MDQEQQPWMPKPIPAVSIKINGKISIKFGPKLTGEFNISMLHYTSSFPDQRQVEKKKLRTTSIFTSR